MYSTKVKRKPYSFRVNKHMYEINGFDRDSLRFGKDPNIVKQEVLDIIKDKLILVVDGRKDFESDLMKEYYTLDIWDLTKSHYYSEKIDIYGSLNKERIGFKRIFWYNFRENCQKYIHTADQDAMNTCKIFREYMRRRESLVRESPNPFPGHIPLWKEIEVLLERGENERQEQNQD